MNKCENCKNWEQVGRTTGSCNIHVKFLLNTKTDVQDEVKLITFKAHYCDKHENNGDRTES